MAKSNFPSAFFLGRNLAPQPTHIAELIILGHPVGLAKSLMKVEVGGCLENLDICLRNMPPEVCYADFLTVIGPEHPLYGSGRFTGPQFGPIKPKVETNAYVEALLTLSNEYANFDLPAKIDVLVWSLRDGQSNKLKSRLADADRYNKQFQAWTDGLNDTINKQLKKAWTHA